MNPDIFENTVFCRGLREEVLGNSKRCNGDL